jgi:general stress protein 26
MALKDIKSIFEKSTYGILATCENGQPKLRPMAFIVHENGNLWSSTYKCSGKVKECTTNSRVEVCFTDTQKRHLRIEGIITLSEDSELKEELLKLNPKVGRHFTGGDDPSYLHIEIKPVRIRWKPAGFSEYIEEKTLA